MGEVMDAVREMQKGVAIKGVALSHRHFLLLDGGSPPPHTYFWATFSFSTHSWFQKRMQAEQHHPLPIKPTIKQRAAAQDQEELRLSRP